MSSAVNHAKRSHKSDRVHRSVVGARSKKVWSSPTVTKRTPLLQKMRALLGFKGSR